MRSVKSPSFFREGLLVGLLLLFIVRLILPVLLKRKINHELTQLPDYTGHVEDVHLALWRGGVSLKDLTLTHRQRDLSLAIKRMSISLSWHELFRRLIVVDVRVESPRVRMLVQRPAQAVKKTKEKTQEVNHVVQEKTGESLPDVLAGLIPFRINSLTLTDGSIRLREKGEDVAAEESRDTEAKKNSSEGQEKEPGLEARVNNIEIAVHNLTNTTKDSGSLLATGTVSAQVMNDGQVDLELRLDPTAHEPKFYLGIQVKHLDLTSLNPILRWQWGIDAKRGIFELFSESAAADGRFKGYLKPLIRDLKMVDVKKDEGAIKIIKEAVVGAVASVFSNSEKDQLGTRIPFEGQFDNPHAGIWDAVLEVLRNAFIEALKPRLDRTIKLSDVSRS